MNKPLKDATTQQPLESWHGLAMFAIYRLFLAAVLLGLYFLHQHYLEFSYFYPAMYLWVALIYLAFNLSSIALLLWRKPSYTTQVWLYVTADIVTVTILVHASNSFINDLGILINISIVAGSLLNHAKRIPLAYAALGTFAIFIQHLFSDVAGGLVLTGYLHVGLLGGTFFATAFLGAVLSNKLRQSESLAQSRQVKVTQLEKLNETIVKQLNMAVAVINEEGEINFTNALFNKWFPQANSQFSLLSLSPLLTQTWQRWLEQPNVESEFFIPLESGDLYQVRFQQVGEMAESLTLVLIDEGEHAKQQAQQLKLASLGRLSASIAHEIRNPLSAISYVGQLMGEQEELRAQEKRFVEIIDKNCRRMNAIITNVLQLSRQSTSNPESIELNAWLTQFVQEYSEVAIPSVNIKLHNQSGDPRVHVDVSQLQQILTNLVDNACRYSEKHTGQRSAHIEVGTTADDHALTLAIWDDGEGISPENGKHLFEPFYTTDNTGTGLGLYIAKALCEANHCRLQWANKAGAGACFTITFR